MGIGVEALVVFFLLKRAGLGSTQGPNKPSRQGSERPPAHGMFSICDISRAVRCLLSTCIHSLG